jgi:hypothetical protein
MAINWTDPSKNSPADLDDYRKFIADTDPTVDHSDLYRPTSKTPVHPASKPARAQSVATG